MTLRRAPGIGRVLAAGGFALSALGLVLFAWAAVGGPLPGALGLSGAQPAEVRAIPEGGALGPGRIAEAVQFDEILNAVDEETRSAARRLLAESATALEGRALDLNDALGNLGPFFEDAAEIVELVRAQRPQVRSLVRDTGAVFDALAADGDALAGAIVGTEQAFGGFADEGEALAETVRILPTFEREARLTLERLDGFQRIALPVVRELTPAADDLAPTLRSLGRLSPPLRDVSGELGPLLDAAEPGLPAFGRTLGELRPALRELDPFLANLNPVVRYLSAYRHFVTGFLANPNLALAATLPELPGQPGPRHMLRVLSYMSAETLSVHPVRLATNRGNGYMPPTVTALEGEPSGYAQEVGSGIFPSFDCKNTDYTPSSQDPDEDEHRLGDGKEPAVYYDWAGCIITDGFGPEWGGGRAPRVVADP